MSRARAALAAAIALGLAGSASAYVPPIDRVARTVADANRAHGRARPLAIAVAVRGEGEKPLAQGTLLSDPAGAARLELAHAGGFVERQLRRGAQLLASRDQAPLDDPHPLLPPLWMLQVGDGATLQARIAELGGDPAAITLGFEGDHDCYVLGGRTGEASYWVDQESLAPVRIDLPGGVRYRLGPMRTQGGIELPAWIALEAPGRPTVTLALEAARPEAPPAGAFAEDWLRAPSPAPAPPAPTGGRPLMPNKLPLASSLVLLGALAASPALADPAWDHQGMQSHHQAVDRTEPHLAPGEKRVGRIVIGAAAPTQPAGVARTLETTTQRQWQQRSSFGGATTPKFDAPRVRAGRYDGTPGVSHSQSGR